MKKKDFFTEHKERRSVRTVGIIFGALFVAGTLHFSLFQSDFFHQIQSSVLESQSGIKTSSVSDITLNASATGSSALRLISHVQMDRVSELRVTLISDPASFSVSNIETTEKWAEVMRISNIPGIYLINIRFKEPVTLLPETVLATIVSEKTKKEITTISISDAQFVSEEKTFELSSSSLEF